MKYLLLQYGNGTQMAKVLDTVGNNMSIHRMDSSYLSWAGKLSKMKVNDERILKELSVEEALAYVREREPRIYLSFTTRTRKSRNIGVRAPQWTPDEIREMNKEISERFAALVAGIKADFADDKTS